METEQSRDEISRKRDALRSITTSGGLRTSVAKLSGSSRVIPSERDFHFYNNFQEFKNPVSEIDQKSKHLLEKVGASGNLFGRAIPFPSDRDAELDDDVAIDWLVNVNDEILERFDISLDEFKARRQEEETTGVRNMRVSEEEENGFQMVSGKKNKKSSDYLDGNVEGGGTVASDVKMAAKLKPKVPFHLPSIPRPQDEYKIIVNNSNQPFDHVWLQKSEDLARFLHPLEKFSVLDFVDKSDSIGEPVKPLPIEVTPFKFVEDVKDLKQLAMKLREVDEFSVDLEHNQYRSFQGLTCLMQISTRTEDFIIDTLKLRVQIGPHLREVFKDPTKRKVMHGADRDILWLQRDFGIYVCNMFDTGQASRVLKLERHSLEHLLKHFCGVTANKEYQNADWRIRPLPKEMIKYAREDTHYLLYIYDLMRARLLLSCADPESSDPPLVDVYKRSYEICSQIYEKELFTDSSYLYIYGLNETELDAQQLAVLSGLFHWRDAVARSEDESTGYILPNRTLIEIAKQMPLTTTHLRRTLKSKLPYIDRNLAALVSIVRHSVQNASQFEEAAKNLKERHLEMENEAKAMATEESDIPPAEDPEIIKGKRSKDKGSSNDQTVSLPSAHGHHEVLHADSNSRHVPEVTVQMLKKPSRGLGAMLGNSVKRKLEPDGRERAETKLEQIKSSVCLPFHTFYGSNKPQESEAARSPNASDVACQEKLPANAGGSSLEDVITLDDDSDESDSIAATPSESNPLEKDKEETDEHMSLADLSSSFNKCLASSDHPKSAETAAPQTSKGFLQVKPFDYEAARLQVKFGEDHKEPREGRNRKKDNKGSGLHGQSQTDERRDLPQGRRRQAFPASGNRSATFH